MSKIITGIHYGKDKRVNGKKGSLWLELQPFNWIVNKDVLQKQHAKHYFKDEWIRPGTIATVVDRPVWNAVYIIRVETGDAADNTIQHLHNANDIIEPMLRVRNPKSKRYEPLMYRLSRMLKFAKDYSHKRQPDQNRVMYLHPGKKNRYVFVNSKHIRPTK